MRGNKSDYIMIDEAISIDIESTFIGVDFSKAEDSVMVIIAGDPSLKAMVIERIIANESTPFTVKQLQDAFDDMFQRPEPMDYRLIEERILQNKRIPMPIYYPPSSIYVDHLDPIAMERCIYDVEPGLRGCRGHVSPYDPNPRKARRYGK